MNTTTGHIHAVGFNGYGQLHKHQNATRIINRFIEFPCSSKEEIILTPLWSRILVGQGNTLAIWSGSLEDPREINFDVRIIALAANEEVCLVILSNHELWKVNLSDSSRVSKLNFLGIECGLEQCSEEQEPEVPLFVTATLRGFYVVSNRNNVYSIPTRIGSLPGNRKVKKLVSGLEHSLVLLDNGDVFVWGGGLKGQLGLGELADIETPTLLEALSGIRIIEIAAGGWHSCAISEFGDLYVWGWNKQGQLGIPVKLKRSIYLLPELIDVVAQDSPDPEEIELINCGTAHSIIFTKSGRLLGTGSCSFGQLSEIASASGFVDQFQSITSPSTHPAKIICGPLTSFILSHVPV